MNDEPEELDIEALAQSYLDKEDEEWTWVNPDDIKRLAQFVIDHVRAQ